MSDDPTQSRNPLQPLTPDQLRQLFSGNLPPVAHVTNIHIAISAVEIALLLGRARQVIDPQTNAPLPGSMIEWFQSLSLNPIAAKQIQLALAQSVAAYERFFGRIPEDPNFQLAPLPDTPAR
jgi:hypothetical protein